MYTKILVPMDGSELAECVLPYVRWFAKVSNVKEIVLIRVVEPLHVRDNLERQFDPDERHHIEQDGINMAKSYCEDIRNRLKDCGITIKAEVLTGKPAEAITDYIAKDKETDLIIMATHGHSGVKRWVRGSTADRVLSTSTVPVLFVRPQLHPPET